MKKEDRDHAKHNTKTARIGSPKTRQSRRAGQGKTTFTPPAAIMGLNLCDRWGIGSEFDTEKFWADTWSLHDSEATDLVRDISGDLFFMFEVGQPDAPQYYVYKSSYDAAVRWLRSEMKDLGITPEKFLQFHGVSAERHLEIEPLENAILESQALLDLLVQKFYSEFLFKKTEQGIFNKRLDRVMTGLFRQADAASDRLDDGFSVLMSSYRKIKGLES